MWFTIAFIPLVKYNLGKKGNIISRIDVGKKVGMQKVTVFINRLTDPIYR